jgi:hypothetical protein
MAVPETAMNEYRFAAWPKYQIWPPRKIFRLKAVSIAHGMH